MPMWTRWNGSVRPPTTGSTIFASPIRAPQRTFGIQYGPRLIDSAPPATTTSASPVWIVCAADTIAWTPVPHRRLTVKAGVSFGIPALMPDDARHVHVLGRRVDDVAEDDLLDLLRLDPGALHRGGRPPSRRARSWGCPSGSCRRSRRRSWRRRRSLLPALGGVLSRFRSAPNSRLSPMPRAVTALAAALLTLVGAAALALAQGGTSAAQGREAHARGALLPATATWAATCSAAGGTSGSIPADQGEAQGLPTNPSLDGWSPTTRPERLERDATTPTTASAARSAWYRKDFVLPSRDAALGWKLRFESVNYRAKVWLNGVLLGEHEFGYVPFELPTTGLVRDGVNRLVVRVDNRRTRRRHPARLRAPERPAGRRLVELRRDPARGLPAPLRGGRRRVACDVRTEIADSGSGRGCAFGVRLGQPRDAATHAFRLRTTVGERERLLSGPSVSAPARAGSCPTAASCAPSPGCGSRAPPSSTRCASRRSRRRALAGRLPAQRRHPRDPRHRRRPAADQRPARAKLFGAEHPRRATRAAAPRCAAPTASATCSSCRDLGATAHPVALSAPSRSTSSSPTGWA